MPEAIRVRVDASPPLFAELVRYALAGADIDAEGTSENADVSVVTPDCVEGTHSRIVIVLHDDTDAALTILLDGQEMPTQRVGIEDIHDLVVDLATPRHGGDGTTDLSH